MSVFAPYDVFISYKSDDSAIAQRVQKLLEANSLRVWRDNRLADSAGEAFDMTISDALDHSARVLVLWSARAIQSDWVRGEAAKAKDQRKLVPLLIEPCADQLPPQFFQDQFLKLAAVEQDVSSLLRALGATTNGIPGQPHAAITQPLVDIDHLPETHTQQIFGRDTELKLMVRAWDGHDVHLIVYDAIGGTGKTALVHHFLHQQLIPAGWRGCRAAFAYSFYSQGATEDKQVDADEFFRRAFALFGQTALGRKKAMAAKAEKEEHLARAEQAKHLGDRDLFQSELEAAKAVVWPPMKPGEKGSALAELIQSERSLLILDGLEPLQYVAGKGKASDTEADSKGHFGGIKDPDVKVLIQRLARHNPGLCLITTRIPITELDKSYPFVVKETLQPLTAAAGTALLRALGVEPALTDDDMTSHVREEFAKAVDELEGHALALTLAGRFVAQHHDGQLKAIHDIPQLQLADYVNEAYRNPFRVFRTVELALLKTLQEAANKGEDPYATTGARQLALLYFLGLFDRPASVKLLEVVFSNGNGQASTSKTPGSRTTAAAPVPSRKPLGAAIKSWFGIRPPKLTPNAPHFDTLPLATLFATFHTASVEQIRYALGQLSNQGLVAKERSSHSSTAWENNLIDCHPLVREYFGLRLRTLDSGTFRAAHGRLYDHYRYQGLPEEFREPVAYALVADQAAFPEFGAKRTVEQLLRAGKDKHGVSEANTPARLLHAPLDHLRATAKLIDTPEWRVALASFLPNDAAGMEPLFGAITHGCLARRYDECFHEVYIPRVTRGNSYFSLHRLGLFGQTLAALASFFEVPFRTPSTQLQDSDQALLLNMAGAFLRAIGRLPDAVEPVHAGMEASARVGDWKGAAADAGNLSELLVILGWLKAPEMGEAGALDTASSAVQFADRSRDRFMRVFSRTALADSLFRAGELSRAEDSFKEAEMLESSKMTSFRGFLYGDLLLARRRIREVEERAEGNLKAMQRAQSLLGVGLSQLQLIQARAISNIESGFRTAISALQKANNEDDLPRGYLALAEHSVLRLETGDRSPELRREIQEALTEAETIAKRGPMPLFLADANLLAARTALALALSELVKKHRDEAARLIAKHHYGRREPDLAVLDCEISPTLEAFRTACNGVGGEGWWHLMPRLEALAGKILDAEPLLVPLRQAEAAYQAERDSYLANEEATQTKSAADSEAQELPDEILPILLQCQRSVKTRQ